MALHAGNGTDTDDAAVALEGEATQRGASRDRFKDDGRSTSETDGGEFVLRERAVRALHRNKRRRVDAFGDLDNPTRALLCGESNDDFIAGAKG